MSNSPTRSEYSRETLLCPVRRWTAYRKWRLLYGVESGALTQTEAMEAHGISAPEWENWSLGLQMFGAESLKATFPNLRMIIAEAAR